MAIQLNNTTTIHKLNKDNGLETLTSLLSLKDRGNLRASCKYLKSEIADVPEEAKAFLVFESNRPLIERIIYKTRIDAMQANSWKAINLGIRNLMFNPYFILSNFAGPVFSIIT